jgi:hypothetical protein
VIPDPTLVWRYLDGLAFPSDRGSILEHARRRGVPDELLRHLEALPNRTYLGRHAITEEYTKT